MSNVLKNLSGSKLVEALNLLNILCTITESEFSKVLAEEQLKSVGISFAAAELDLYFNVVQNDSFKKTLSELVANRNNLKIDTSVSNSGSEPKKDDVSKDSAKKTEKPKAAELEVEDMDVFF